MTEQAANAELRDADGFDEFLDHAMAEIAGRFPEAEQVAVDAAMALIPKVTPMRNEYPR